jgi:hypothetical protein
MANSAKSLANMLFEPPAEKRHPHDYDWTDVTHVWQSKDFFTYARVRQKKCDVQLDLFNYPSGVVGEHSDDYVFEGVEFDDGTLVISLGISEFQDTESPNRTVTKFYVLRPRQERWASTKKQPYRPDPMWLGFGETLL